MRFLICWRVGLSLVRWLLNCVGVCLYVVLLDLLGEFGFGLGWVLVLSFVGGL